MLENQKNLLNYYITSFTDNNLSLKVYLNSEIGRLKETLSNALETSVIKEDNELKEKTTQVIEKLQQLHSCNVEEKVVLTVLKTQQLVEEITNDAD
ncbi:MAG TPA: hypothetical protein DF712_09430 [Balneola sp.]|nr:hypothetical protein [Balneola sp.]